MWNSPGAFPISDKADYRKISQSILPAWFGANNFVSLLHHMYIYVISCRVVCRVGSCRIVSYHIIYWWYYPHHSVTLEKLNWHIGPGRCGCNLDVIVFNHHQVLYLWLCMWKCRQVNAKGLHLWFVNIGSVNEFVPSASHYRSQP